MNRKSQVPLTKSLAILISGLMLSTGCAPLISAQQEREFGMQALQEIAQPCPTTNELEHIAVLVTLAEQSHAAQDPDGFWISAIETCPGLTTEAKAGYTALVFSARDRFNQRVYAVKYNEWQRRTGNVQQAGRIMMEAQRTDDLNRIRRDLQDY